MQYKVNDTVIAYEASGEKEFGQRKVLLHGAKDITAGNLWSQRGFTIEPLFTQNKFSEFHADVVSLIFELWRTAGLNVPDNFSPDQYHKLISDHPQHLRAVDQTKLISTDLFPSGIANI